MITRYDNDSNLVAWVRPLDSDAMAELESAHCYAAEFGTVLEWCSTRTDTLFMSTSDALECEECGEPIEADDSPGVYVHERTDDGYDRDEDHPARPPEDHASALGAAMARAAVAYTQIRDARRVERVLRGEAA